MWKAIALGLAISLGITVATVHLSKDRFVRTTDRMISDLLAVGSSSMSLVEEEHLEGLPSPVRRWLVASGVVGKPTPQCVRLRQEGEIRLAPNRPWMTFYADQYYTLDPPAFLWRVTANVAHGIFIQGVDSFREGRGSMRMLPWALFAAVDASGPSLDQGAALRYLQEIVWFPFAALAKEIVWEAIDNASARATLSLDNITVSGVFHFDADGHVIDFHALRHRDGDGLREWRTPLHSHQTRDGIVIPSEGKGVWLLEEPFSYIRLRVIDLNYDVDEIFPRR